MSACKSRLAIVGPTGDHLLVCTKDATAHDTHEGRYKTETIHGEARETTVAWYSGDRREYTGRFYPCMRRHCSLPRDHRGAHTG